MIVFYVNVLAGFACSFKQQALTIKRNLITVSRFPVTFYTFYLTISLLTCSEFKTRARGGQLAIPKTCVQTVLPQIKEV